VHILAMCCMSESLCMFRMICLVLLYLSHNKDMVGFFLLPIYLYYGLCRFMQL
jgi:hypothetical protein